MKLKLYSLSLTRWTSSMVLLLVLVTTTYGWDGNLLNKLIMLVKPPVSAARKPGKPASEHPAKISEVPRQPRAGKKSVVNDPIRFTIVGNKSVVSAGEPLELTIKAELLDIPSSLMFFTEDASSFRLKVLPPPGFIVTGGSYQELIGDKLSLKGKSTATYTLQGHFEATTPSMCFRLLRGGGQADNSSLFVEKGSFCLQGVGNTNARLATGVTSLGGVQKPAVTNNVVGACPAITKVRYFARYDGWLERLPGSSVLGSNDNQTWTTLATITTAPSGGGWQEINLTNTTSYRYLRWQAGANSYGEIKELEFYAGTQLLTGTQVNSNTAAFNNQTADYGPQNAFDGNTNTMWHTNSPGSTNYVGYDLDCTVGSGEPSTAINCYIITNKQSGQYLQATTSNTINHVAQASGLPNQVWQFETMTDGKLRISSADGTNKYMYVDAYSDNQPIRLGPDNATSTKYRWVRELVSGTSYRVRSENMPWDQEYAGTQPVLQIWGDVTTYSLAQTYNWDQFYFQSASCPTSGNFLTVTPGSLTNVVAGGTTQSISVNSNVNWSVSSSASWLTVSAASGSNSGSFVVTVQDNPGVTRTGSVSVTGGGITQPISINQLGNSGDGLVSGNCYVIKSQIGGSTSTLQAMTDNSVQFQLPVESQANQIWKAEGTNNSYKFISQTGTNLVMYVNSLQSGQSLLLGSDVTGSGVERYRWSLASSINNSFRVYGGPNQNTWDHAGAGSVNFLQLYGSNTDTNDGDWNQPYRRFSFTPATCPTTGCNPPTLSLGLPACTGTSTYSVAFSVSAGGSVSATAGTVSMITNQITDIPRNSNITVTAILNNCQSQLTLSAPSGCPVEGDPFIKQDLVTKRWWGLNMYYDNLNAQGGMTPQDNRMLTASAAHHANFVFATLNWDRLQKPSGAWDFALLDSVGRRALELGLKVFIRFDVSVGLNGNPSFYIPTDRAAYDENGVIGERDDRRTLSLDADENRNRVNALITATLQHAKTTAYAGVIMGVSVTVDAQKENEYPQVNRYGTNNEVPVLFDYSQPSLQKFIARMQAKYGNISAANIQWGTTFQSWTDPNLKLPIGQRDSPTALVWTFNTPMLRDFYSHRQQSLADFINSWHDVVKGISPNLATMTEFGSMYDNISKARGTLTIQPLLRVDAIKQNSGPEDNSFVLSAAISLRDRTAEKWAAEEVAMPGVYDLQTQIDWVVRAYDAGCSFVNYALYYWAGGDSDPTLLNQAEARIAALGDAVHAAKPIGGTVPRPAIDQTFTISSRELLLHPWIESPGNGQAPYRQQFFDMTQNGTKTIRVKIENDF